MSGQQCARCQRHMVHRGQVRLPGQVASGGRGLCCACYVWVKRNGRLDDYPLARPTRPGRLRIVAGRLVAIDAPRHGTRAIYGHWGCRCEECTEANRADCARMQEERVARRADGLVAVGDVEHGSPSTYSAHGCRCPDCTAANTEKSRRRRAERGVS